MNQGTRQCSKQTMRLVKENKVVKIGLFMAFTKKQTHYAL